MDQSTINDVMINNTHNVNIINKMIQLGGNYYKETFEIAVKQGNMDTINVLKTYVSPNEGKLIACKYGNCNLVRYFNTATNNDECIQCAANYNHTNIYDILCNYCSVNAILISSIVLQYDNNINNLINNATNINDALHMACIVGNLSIVKKIILKKPSNIHECITMLSGSDSKYDEIKLILLNNI